MRYFRLANGGAEIRLRLRKNDAHVELHNSSVPREHLRRSVEYTLAILLSRFRFTTGVNWSPREVHFSFSAPQNLSDYHAVFQAPVRFNQPVNQLVLDQSLLNLPHPQADAALCEVLDHYLQQMLRVMPEEDNLIEEIHRIVNTLHPQEGVRITSVARQLAMSDRNLQRRLLAKGTSFREVLNQTRSESALRLLREKGVDVRDVSYMLGFSEPSSFYRAFKQWTGKTPQEYRNS